MPCNLVGLRIYCADVNYNSLFLFSSFVLSFAVFVCLFSHSTVFEIALCLATRFIEHVNKQAKN